MNLVEVLEVEVIPFQMSNFDPIDNDIEYDEQGRMLYHPDFHDNHGKRFSEEDLEYLCKYWEVDSKRSLAYALGRPEKNLAAMVTYLRKTNKYEYYKSLNKHW